VLVLSRKENERIVIGDGIELVILNARRGSVRLGFTAPIHVPIHRKEVALRIEKEAVGKTPRYDR
jgi:carbon storage regulator